MQNYDARRSQSYWAARGSERQATSCGDPARAPEVLQRVCHVVSRHPHTAGACSKAQPAVRFYASAAAPCMSRTQLYRWSSLIEAGRMRCAQASQGNVLRIDAVCSLFAVSTQFNASLAQHCCNLNLMSSQSALVRGPRRRGRSRMAAQTCVQTPSWKQAGSKLEASTHLPTQRHCPFLSQNAKVSVCLHRPASALPNVLHRRARNQNDLWCALQIARQDSPASLNSALPSPVSTSRAHRHDTCVQ